MALVIETVIDGVRAWLEVRHLETELSGLYTVKLSSQRDRRQVRCSTANTGDSLWL